MSRTPESEGPTFDLRVSADGVNWQRISGLVGWPRIEESTVASNPYRLTAENSVQRRGAGEVISDRPSIATSIYQVVPTARYVHRLPGDRAPTADEIAAIRTYADRQYVRMTQEMGTDVTWSSGGGTSTPTVQDIQEELDRLYNRTMDLESVGAMTPDVRDMAAQARDLLVAEGQRLLEDDTVDDLRRTWVSTVEALRSSCRVAAASCADLRQAMRSLNLDHVSTTANQRARALLLRHLTHVQVVSYRSTGSFLVQGSNGGVYRINSWKSVNVESVGSWCEGRQLVGSNGRPLRSKKGRAIRKAMRRLESSRPTCVLGASHVHHCVHVSGGDPMDYSKASSARRLYCLELPDCPLPDQLLAQKLMIEADEGEFLSQAISAQAHLDLHAARSSAAATTS